MHGLASAVLTGGKNMDFTPLGELPSAVRISVETLGLRNCIYPPSDFQVALFLPDVLENGEDPVAGPVALSPSWGAEMTAELREGDYEVALFRRQWLEPLATDLVHVGASSETVYLKAKCG